jgi:hypothetical protein
MKRRNFLVIAGSSIVIAGVTYYLLSDTSNFVRADQKQTATSKLILQQDERTILSLAALAPSGHNTQPWFIKYIEPFHWIVGNDSTKWLPAVDPSQRETILSIGAFLQNLEYAAGSLGYICQINILAASNQDENIVSVKLIKAATAVKYDTEKIKLRRTVRSNYMTAVLKNEDLAYLVNDEQASIHYFPNTSNEHQWLNEQTITANRIQSYRDDAQQELANWIRFSSKAAAAHLDGLTLAGMEINGIPAWYLRNFYGEKEVMKNNFREQSIDKVVQQVSQSAGWLLITSKDNLTATLLGTGKKMQRLFLKVRDKNIALHPMTQIIEEVSTNKILHSSIGINEPIQFILRTGYLKKYPAPVSLRRPIEQFVKT